MSTRVHAPVGIPVQTARELVSLAIRAPSVHNTQPWAWRIGPDSIELYADESRRLGAADPTGRNLVISCGAALHHLRVAARASGLLPVVARLPDPARSRPVGARHASPPPRLRHRCGGPARHRGALHRPPSLHLVAGTERAVEPPGAHRRRRRRRAPSPSPT